MTSGAKADGRFGKQDFVYDAAEDIYRCPAGEKLTYRMTSEQDGKMMRRYWTNACSNCPLQSKCTTGNERRIPRWEHEHILEAAQRRLDENPQAMRERRETVEHPFGTLKMRMGSTHFLMKRLPKVATEMALHVLAYNITRVMNIMGAADRGDESVTRQRSRGLHRSTRSLRLLQGGQTCDSDPVQAKSPLADRSTAISNRLKTLSRNQDPKRTFA